MRQPLALNENFDLIHESLKLPNHRSSRNGENPMAFDVKELQLATESDQVSHLTRRREGDVEKFAIVLRARACTSFNDVGRHRCRGASYLLPDSVPLVLREVLRVLVDSEGERVRIVKDAQLAVISGHPDRQGTIRSTR